MKIAVIGAGIIGTTSALVLIESLPNLDITIIADRFTPNTTADGAGGMICPSSSKLSDQLKHKYKQWFVVSVNYYKQMFKSSNAGEIGVGLCSMYRLLEEDNLDATHLMVSHRKLTQNELELFPCQWTGGYFMTTYYVECKKLLPFLLQKFKSKGGNVVEMKVNNIEEMVGKYDIIVNCTGVEAFNLVNDQGVYPVRGQLVRVEAPWIKHGIMTPECHIILNSGSVVLGGTNQINDWNREVNPKDSERIIDLCCQLCPSLRSAKVLGEWVGLRPGRMEVRLEREVVNKDGQSLNVIHNYGHGGSGITLSWGCAHDVLQIVNDIIEYK